MKGKNNMRRTSAWTPLGPVPIIKGYEVRWIRSAVIDIKNKWTRSRLLKRTKKKFKGYPYVKSGKFKNYLGFECPGLLMAKFTIEENKKMLRGWPNEW